jgi:hypothetical protein
MIAEMVIWGFFSAIGWMSANWTVDQLTSKKETKEEQVCSAWKEETQSDGTTNRSRTCEIKTSP